LRKINLAPYSLFADMKFAVEPAGAAATAVLCGSLREQISGQRVGVIVCGTNIDAATFAHQMIPWEPGLNA
jgi:threonine dehydratase